MRRMAHSVAWPEKNIWGGLGARGPQRDGNLVQGVEEVQEIQLKIANEKLCILVGTGLGTCRVDVELRGRRIT